MVPLVLVGATDFCLCVSDMCVCVLVPGPLGWALGRLCCVFGCEPAFILNPTHHHTTHACLACLHPTIKLNPPQVTQVTHASYPFTPALGSNIQTISTTISSLNNSSSLLPQSSVLISSPLSSLALFSSLLILLLFPARCIIFLPSPVLSTLPLDIASPSLAAFKLRVTRTQRPAQPCTHQTSPAVSQLVSSYLALFFNTRLTHPPSNPFRLPRSRLVDQTTPSRAQPSIGASQSTCSKQSLPLPNTTLAL